MMNSPWARLITPMRPNTTARPSVAIRSTAALATADISVIATRSTSMARFVPISATFCIVQAGKVLRELRLCDQIADLLLEGGPDTVVRLNDIEITLVVAFGDENALHQMMGARIKCDGTVGRIQ